MFIVSRKTNIYNSRHFAGIPLLVFFFWTILRTKREGSHVFLSLRRDRIRKRDDPLFPAVRGAFRSSVLPPPRGNHKLRAFWGALR